MAKRQNKKRKETSAGKRVPVWHVFHWKERYAVDTESMHYLSQFCDLETLAGDWRQYHTWKSTFEDIRMMTASFWNDVSFSGSL